MDQNRESYFEPIKEGSYVSSPAFFGDVLRAAFGTPWRVAVTIVATTIVVLGGIIVWMQIIEPVLFSSPQSALSATVSYNDGSNGLAPSVDKPFRCSPEFLFKNDASKQVAHECKR